MSRDVGTDSTFQSETFKSVCLICDSAGGWGAAAQAAVAALDPLPDGANLGFLYATDPLAEDLGSILAFLKAKTKITQWVGTVGMGVLGNGLEIYDRPALSLLVGRLPEESFRLFDTITEDTAAFCAQNDPWIAEQFPTLGLVHGDPRNPEIAELIQSLSQASSAFLVGGLSSSRGALPQIAGQVCDGGLSGLLLSSNLPVAVGLTQGCSPVGPNRMITDAEETIVQSIEDQPAVDVLKEDIGEILSRDLSRIGGYIYASFPIPGSDTGDYLVRNIIGIDPARGWLQVAEEVTPGMAIGFCRRDHDSAKMDLRRMLKDLLARAEGPPKAALYFSCIARGQHLFGGQSEEMREIGDALGNVPLAGFFANGEISHNRLYAYTGVLTLLM
ncbi:MAG: FIST C-terminal domain-containing protein [Pseudomonadota bacterium]